MAAAVSQLTEEAPGTTTREIDDRRLGIVGAGKFGTTLARAAVAAGYDVAISGSGPSDNIELAVEILAPGARATTTDDVVRHADVIVLAVPSHRFRELQPDLFAGKVLVDATNYWPPVDGDDPELADAPEGTSTIVQAALSLSPPRQEPQPTRLPPTRRKPTTPRRTQPDRNRRSRRRPARRPHGHATTRPARLRPSRRRPTQERSRPRARRLTNRDHLQRRTAGQAHLALMTGRNRRAMEHLWSPGGATDGNQQIAQL
jgi:hypothetical protein